jgi:hypothetical protein
MEQYKLNCNPSVVERRSDVQIYFRISQKASHAWFCTEVLYSSGWGRVRWDVYVDMVGWKYGIFVLTINWSTTEMLLMVLNSKSQHKQRHGLPGIMFPKKNLQC